MLDVTDMMGTYAHSRVTAAAILVMTQSRVDTEPGILIPTFFAQIVFSAKELYLMDISTWVNVMLGKLVRMTATIT